MWPQPLREEISRHYKTNPLLQTKTVASTWLAAVTPLYCALLFGDILNANIADLKLPLLLFLLPSVWHIVAQLICHGHCYISACIVKNRSSLGTAYGSSHVRHRIHEKRAASHPSISAIVSIWSIGLYLSKCHSIVKFHCDYINDYTATASEGPK